MSREDSKIRDRKIRDVERERRQEEKDNGLGIGWAMLDDELTALKAERERDELILLSQTRQQDEEETQVPGRKRQRVEDTPKIRTLAAAMELAR